MAKFKIEITSDGGDKSNWFAQHVGKQFECKKETKNDFFPDPDASPLIPPAKLLRVTAVTIPKDCAKKIK